jgi:hypothetical protein
VSKPLPSTTSETPGCTVELLDDALKMKPAGDAVTCEFIKQPIKFFNGSFDFINGALKMEPKGERMPLQQSTAMVDRVATASL